MCCTLILTYRYDVGVIRQNVSGLQNRIGKQPDIARQAARYFILVRNTSLQQSHGSVRHQQPTQFADLWHVTLHKQYCVLWIEPQGQQVDGGIQRQFHQLLLVSNRRQGMQIRDEIVSFIFRLQVDVLPDRTKIVAPVKTTGRLNSRKYAHEFSSGPSCLVDKNVSVWIKISVSLSSPTIVCQAVVSIEPTIYQTDNANKKPRPKAWLRVSYCDLATHLALGYGFAIQSIHVRKDQITECRREPRQGV